MKEILNRLGAKTPTFFKNIISISLAITTLSGLLLGSGLVFPESIGGLIAKAGIIAGIVSAFISKLTTIYGVKDGEIVKPDSTIMYEPETINPDTKPNPPKKEP